MNRFLLAVVFVLACVKAGQSYGAELRILDPSYLAMDYYKVGNNRDLYLGINDQGSTKFGEDGETWRYGAAVHFSFDLVSYGDYAVYFHNYVHMAATECCVRHVGWEYELGTRVGPHLDAFWLHHSQHALDLNRTPGRFPLVNYFGVRFIMLEKGRK